jgi:hypothetical protein
MYEKVYLKSEKNIVKSFCGFVVVIRYTDATKSFASEKPTIIQ